MTIHNVLRCLQRRPDCGIWVKFNKLDGFIFREAMNVETLREYCLSKREVTESFPFDDTTLVFKVLDRMFALLSLDGDLSINLKCDPDKALELRERYPCVLPGYHMNKAQWNTVMIDGSVPENLVREWIDHSYDEVVKKMPKSKQKLLQ